MSAKGSRILPFLWSAVILTFSSLPHIEIPGPEFNLKDKLGHFAEYAILGYLMILSRWKKKVYFAWGLCLPAFDELHQLFIPGREADIFDFLFDILGIFVIYSFFLCVRSQRITSS